MENSERQKTIEQKISGTDYPYYYIGEKGFLMNLRLKASRIIAPINPFAKVGV